MGPARTGWREIPLARRDGHDCASIWRSGRSSGPVCTNIGNPHATFFVADAEAIDLADARPASSSTIRCFPSAPISASRRCCDRARIRLRVWERGVGITRACGTGACAALVAARRRGLTGRHARRSSLDGGELEIDVARGRAM